MKWLTRFFTFDEYDPAPERSTDQVDRVTCDCLDPAPGAVQELGP